MYPASTTRRGGTVGSGTAGSTYGNVALIRAAVATRNVSSFSFPSWSANRSKNSTPGRDITRSG